MFVKFKSKSGQWQIPVEDIKCFVVHPKVQREYLGTRSYVATVYMKTGFEYAVDTIEEAESISRQLHALVAPARPVFTGLQDAFDHITKTWEQPGDCRKKIGEW